MKKITKIYGVMIIINGITLGIKNYNFVSNGIFIEGVVIYLEEYKKSKYFSDMNTN